MSENHGRILIVDDDEDILTAGKLLLKRHFKSIATVNRPDNIPKLMNEGAFDAVLLDMNFGAGERSGREGLDWLRRILAIDPDVVVILITAHSAVGTAVEAMKLGASDFVEKPWQNEKLIATLKAAVNLRQTRDEAAALKHRNRELSAHISGAGDDMLGSSSAMQVVLSMIARAAPTEANVLVLGENGTGKELAARQLHRQSNRAGAIFMSVDLGAVTESLFESELFGHKKGAFTGANEDRIGRFQAASGGTLFLDEIGNIPLHLQAKLLTVLEQRQVLPVGANQPVSIDVRVISATNLPASKLADESVFRQDLLYRLNTVEIALPPLRERTGDIPVLVEHFVALYAQKYGREIKGIDKQAMAHIDADPWPGNVRALRHAVERAIILSEGDRLGVEDFNLAGAVARQADADGAADDLTLLDLEKRAIGGALKRHTGNVSRAARDLGITRASLYRRMEKHDL
ncbi:MAG: sigma-54-dependent Fis family transcriptional regulator [Proteobacteria bacterium]|nr:sigma-54-dependent Fis family transcriptional regulator [Pseudomonadota bacterium]